MVVVVFSLLEGTYLQNKTLKKENNNKETESNMDDFAKYYL